MLETSKPGTHEKQPSFCCPNSYSVVFHTFGWLPGAKKLLHQFLFWTPMAPPLYYLWCMHVTCCCTCHHHTSCLESMRAQSTLCSVCLKTTLNIGNPIMINENTHIKSLLSAPNYNSLSWKPVPMSNTSDHNLLLLTTRPAARQRKPSDFLMAQPCGSESLGIRRPHHIHHQQMWYFATAIHRRQWGPNTEGKSHTVR